MDSSTKSLFVRSICERFSGRRRTHDTYIFYSVERQTILLVKGEPLGRERTKEHSYLSLVRPIVEYVTIAWSPHTKKGIDIFESIQSRAAHFLNNDHSRSFFAEECRSSSRGWGRGAHLLHPPLRSVREHPKAFLRY